MKPVDKRINKIVRDDDKEFVCIYNRPIYDEKGYFTGKFDEDDTETVTLIKHPLFDDPKK